MENESLSGWEDIFVGENDCLQRYKVEGGYLYHNTMNDEDDPKYFNSTMCFVPDIDLERYQSHLRDAYSQGFKDGMGELTNILDSDTLSCCRHGVPVKLNTCVPCQIQRLKDQP